MADQTTATAGPNPQQSMSIVRWAVATFGGALAGYIGGKGWASTSSVLGALNSDTFIQGVSAVGSLAVLVWGLFAHNQKNTVAAASKMPNVAVVVTTDTPAGKDLAASIPGPAVSPAGSPEAQALAK